jgi:hypothetical protein
MFGQTISYGRRKNKDDGHVKKLIFLNSSYGPNKGHSHLDLWLVTAFS